LKVKQLTGPYIGRSETGFDPKGIPLYLKHVFEDPDVLTGKSLAEGQTKYPAALRRLRQRDNFSQCG